MYMNPIISISPNSFILQYSVSIYFLIHVNTGSVTYEHCYTINSQGV